MGRAVYSTDYVGNRVTLTMNYKATYDQGKGLISYLNSATDRKYTIDSMSMTYNETDDAMTGTIVLSTFDITGSDRTVPAVTVQNVPVGSSNLFTSIPSIPEVVHRDRKVTVLYQITIFS